MIEVHYMFSKLKKKLTLSVRVHPFDSDNLFVLHIVASSHIPRLLNCTRVATEKSSKTSDYMLLSFYNIGSGRNK